MRETRRLSDTSPNPLTRALLRSGRGDAPSGAARRHAAMTIGVAGVITASAGTAGATGGATGVAAASKWVASAALLKWAGATIVGATLAGGVLAAEVAHERSREPPAQEPRAAAAVAARPAPLAGRSSPPAAPEAPAEVPQPATTASEPVSGSSRESSPKSAASVERVEPPTPSDEGASLRAELDLVDRARVALSDGHPDRALADLEAYRRAFPHAVLSNEAAVLRIEALARSGREEAAAREATSFLARDPGSPHAARVRGLLTSIASESGAR